MILKIFGSRQAGFYSSILDQGWAGLNWNPTQLLFIMIVDNVKKIRFYLLVILNGFVTSHQHLFDYQARVIFLLKISTYNGCALSIQFVSVYRLKPHHSLSMKPHRTVRHGRYIFGPDYWLTFHGTIIPNKRRTNVSFSYIYSNFWYNDNNWIAFCTWSCVLADSWAACKVKGMT